MCVVRINVTKNKLYWCHGYLLVQNADCRPDTKCRLGTKCRLQTAEWVQNADWEPKEFFRLVYDNMPSYNLPSVTQLLFRNQLSRLFALSWNIPGPHLDQDGGQDHLTRACTRQLLDKNYTIKFFSAFFLRVTTRKSLLQKSFSESPCNLTRRSGHILKSKL